MSQAEPDQFDPIAPSGQQVTISSGQHEAVIVEVGGGLRTYTVAGRDVLDGYDINERCSDARGQPLIPWPNRLHQGKYEWDGQQLQAPINEVDKGNALHGYTMGHNWTVTTTSQNEAVATLRLHPQEGYPFALDLSVTYTLGQDGITVTTTARNVGAHACPYAHGAHPYITIGTELIDEATLTVPANTYLPTDESQIPVSRATVEGTQYDFRSPRTIGVAAVDHAFTDLIHGDDGRARVVLTSATTRRSVTVWIDSSYPYVMIYTGDTLKSVPRRRQGLGVEPMTCPPNAFATGEHVLRLEPGQSITTRWGISVEDR